MEKIYLSLKTGIIMQTKSLMPTNLLIPDNFKASYPFITLTFYQTYLEIKIHTPIKYPSVYKMIYELKYENIEYMQRGFMYMNIFHHQPDVSKHILVLGLFGARSIFNKINHCVKENNLPIVMKN